MREGSKGVGAVCTPVSVWAPLWARAHQCACLCVWACLCVRACVSARVGTQACLLCAASRVTGLLLLHKKSGSLFWQPSQPTPPPQSLKTCPHSNTQPGPDVCQKAESCFAICPEGTQGKRTLRGEVRDVAPTCSQCFTSWCVFPKLHSVPPPNPCPLLICALQLQVSVSVMTSASCSSHALMSLKGRTSWRAGSRLLHVTYTGRRWCWGLRRQVTDIVPQQAKTLHPTFKLQFVIDAGTSVSYTGLNLTGSSHTQPAPHTW